MNLQELLTKLETPFVIQVGIKPADWQVIQRNQ